MLMFALPLGLVHIRLPIQALARRGEIELCRLMTNEQARSVMAIKSVARRTYLSREFLAE
jgi:hypothetical protein